MPNIWHIWHTQHQKQSIMRYAICAKNLRHITVRFHFWHGMDWNAIYVYYYFIRLSLSSQLKYNFIFHVQPLLFCFTISTLPHSFLLPFALFCFTLPSFSLPYSLQLPLYHHWSIKIRFTGFFFPFFLLSPLCSMIWYIESKVYLRVADLQFKLGIVDRKFISVSPIRRSEVHLCIAVQVSSPSSLWFSVFWFLLLFLVFRYLVHMCCVLCAMLFIYLFFQIFCITEWLLGCKLLDTMDFKF